MSRREKPPEGGAADEAGQKPSATERFADLVGDARPIDSHARSSSTARPPRPPIVPRRRSPAPASPPASDGAPPTSFRWPDPGNRHLAAGPGVGDQQLNRLGRGEPEPEERIDLHGTRVAEAQRLLAQRLASAQARGLRCVVVVHGRGRGSATNDAPLRDAVPDWLTRGSTGRRVLAFAPAPRQQGGDGATLVLLRKSAAVP